LYTPDIEDRQKVEWTPAHEKSVADFYFLAYVYHFVSTYKKPFCLFVFMFDVGNVYMECRGGGTNDFDF
jgi:hypothetical protein